MAMGSVSDGTFRFADNEADGNLSFLEREGYVHDGIASDEYTYNGLSFFGTGNNNLQNKGVGSDCDWPPLYWHNICGSARNMLDRFYGLAEEGALSGKSLRFLFQGAAPEKWMMEAGEYTMKRFAGLYGMEYAGMAPIAPRQADCRRNYENIFIKLHMGIPSLLSGSHTVPADRGHTRHAFAAADGKDGRRGHRGRRQGQTASDAFGLSGDRSGKMYLPVRQGVYL